MESKSSNDRSDDRSNDRFSRESLQRRVHELVISNDLPDVSIYAQKSKSPHSPPRPKTGSNKPISLMSLKSKTDAYVPSLANALVVGIGSNAAGAARISHRQQLLHRKASRDNELMLSQVESMGQVGSQGSDRTSSFDSLRDQKLDSESTNPKITFGTRLNSQSSETLFKDTRFVREVEPSAPQEPRGAEKPTITLQRKAAVVATGGSNITQEETSAPTSNGISQTSVNNIRERLKALRALQEAESRRFKSVVDDPT